MKHVAYLIPTLDRIGGAEQQVILLAGGLAKRGWRVSVIALVWNWRQRERAASISGYRFLESSTCEKGLRTREVGYS